MGADPTTVAEPFRPEPQSWLGRHAGRLLLRVLRAVPGGGWLEREFTAAGPVGAVEKSGYRFWAPIALAIGTAEILGALADRLKRTILIPWPTISSTVGFIESRTSLVAVVVVGAIAMIALAALSGHAGDETGGRTVRVAADTTPLAFYRWRVVVGIVLVGLAASLSLGWDKNQIGFTVYGLFLVFGILIPTTLAYFGMLVPFPPLLFTIKKLRGRLHWLAALIVGGLAVLSIHLAFYPWPDLVREPAVYAGLSGTEAHDAADRKIASLGAAARLAFRTETRGFFGVDPDGNPEAAWIVEYEPATGFGSGCVVAVHKRDGATGATSSPACG